MYQTNILGVFSKPEPIVLVVAGNHKEFIEWRYQAAPLGIKSKYVRDHHDIIGYHDPDVVFVGTWRKRKGISKILEELQHTRMSKTQFWNDGDVLDQGSIVFPLGKCYFPAMRKPQDKRIISSHPFVTSPTRLKAHWEVSAAEDLKAFHGIDCETELVKPSS